MQTYVCIILVNNSEKFQGPLLALFVRYYLLHFYISGSGVHVDINCTLRNKIYLFTFVSIVLFETGLICPAIKLIFRLISSVL